MRRSGTPAVDVRRATPADVPAMARAHARSWRATYTGLLPDAVIDEVVGSERQRIERWRTRLAAPAKIGGSFVAELDGDVVGFVFWGPSEGRDATPGVAEVQAIYLDPEVIGVGIGRLLLAAAVADIAAAGYSGALLWVLDANDRARRFYEGAGWHADGATKADVRSGGTLHEVRYSRTFEAPTETPT